MTTSENPHDDMSTSAVAKALGVSPSLVRTWIGYMNWEVRRNAEGHRVFAREDLEQLQALKDWLDGGHSLKEYRRERQIEGPFDPRLELRSAFRRLKELQSQEEALLAKQRELAEAAAAQRQALESQLDGLKASLPAESSEEPADHTAPDLAPRAVQGVLKQLLSALLEKQGKLQLVRRYEEAGRVRLEYATAQGKKQVIEDVCSHPEDRQLFELVLGVITSQAAPHSEPGA